MNTNLKGESYYRPPGSKKKIEAYKLTRQAKVAANILKIEDEKGVVKHYNKPAEKKMILGIAAMMRATLEKKKKAKA